MLYVVLCPGTPEGSTGSGSGLKASQKTGQRLKVSSGRLGEAGNRTCDPWFTRHMFIPYTTAASNLYFHWFEVWHVRRCNIVCGNISVLISKYLWSLLKYLLT